jgi:electron transport complex protein RnfD
MATDMVTSPTTRSGRWIFGAACGLLSVLIRAYGGFPEGVCYAILFMNCLNPLIEQYVRPRRFGARGLRKEAAK